MKMYKLKVNSKLISICIHMPISATLHYKYKYEYEYE